jgi:hypothetical protein
VHRQIEQFHAFCYLIRESEWPIKPRGLSSPYISDSTTLPNRKRTPQKTPGKQADRCPSRLLSPGPLEAPPTSSLSDWPSVIHGYRCFDRKLSLLLPFSFSPSRMSQLHLRAKANEAQRGMRCLIPRLRCTKKAQPLPPISGRAIHGMVCYKRGHILTLSRSLEAETSCLGLRLHIHYVSALSDS